MKTKWMFLTAGIFWLISGSGPVFGQASGGLGYFSPGIHTIRFTRLNDFLPAGYPQITNQPFVTAGGGYGIYKSFVIGGEGGTMHAGSFTRDNQQLDLSGDFGFFSLGYVVLKQKGFLAYPLVSVGSNTLQMYVHEKDQNASFGTVTAEPYQAATFLYKAKMLKLAAAGLYTIKGFRAKRAMGGLLIGLEAGYQMSYKTGVWSYDNGDISDGPDFNNNGFFVQLLIGGGGIVNN